MTEPSRGIRARVNAACALFERLETSFSHAIFRAIGSLRAAGAMAQCPYNRMIEIYHALRWALRTLHDFASRAEVSNVVDAQESGKDNRATEIGRGGTERRNRSPAPHHVTALGVEFPAAPNHRESKLSQRRSHLHRPPSSTTPPPPTMRRIPRLSRPIDRALDAATAPRSQCRACAFSTTSARAAESNKSSGTTPFTERLRSKIWGTDYAPGREDPYSSDSPMRDSQKTAAAPQRPAQTTTPGGPKRPVRQVQQDSYQPAKTWHGLEWVGGKQWGAEQEQVSPFAGRVTGLTCSACSRESFC